MKDCVEFLRGERIPFISKYKDTLNPCDTIELRKTIIKLIKQSIYEDIPSDIPSNIIEVLKTIDLTSMPKERLEQHTKKALLDFNYSVKVLMSSDTSSVVKIPIVQLELFIKDVNNFVERVVLEFNKDELKSFIDQLNQIEKVM